MPDTSLSLVPAVIDATDAEVLAPESAPVELSAEQAKALDTCQFHLYRLGRRIAAREADLIYLYVEFGWQLSKAQAVHNTDRDIVSRSAQGHILGSAPGFTKWLEQSDVSIHPRMAQRYILAAKNAGITAESTSEDVRVLKEAAKLHGQTLTALCRKPVDKTDQTAEIHEVTDEERAQQEEEERNERWQSIAAQLHDYGIEADEWAKLDNDRRAGLYDVLTELAKRIKPSLRKGKPAPAIPALTDKAPASEPQLFHWRVGQREGQSRWQIKRKQGSGWQVAHEVESIEQAAAWLRGQGVDFGTVAVLTVAPWPPLDKYLEENSAAPAATPERDGDPECTHEAMARGLWWWGWIGHKGMIMAKPYHGDMKEIIEGRAHPRVGKTLIGPFYAETLGDAEKIIREQDIHAKI